MCRPRAGKTLVELLVVAAVVAVLAGLVVAAVQKVRTRAARLRDENNVRQVGLACQGYDAQHGRLPYPNEPLFPVRDTRAGGPVYQADASAAVLLMPLLDGPSLTLDLYTKSGSQLPWLVLPAYVSPLDPTHAAGRVNLTPASPHIYYGVGNYALNIRVLCLHDPRTLQWQDYNAGGLRAGVPDGTSNTLLLATRHGRCGTPRVVAGFFEPLSGGSLFACSTASVWPPSQINPMPTAGAYFGMAVPAADGTGPTFQTAVGVADCDPEQAHGFERGVIVAGLCDGSVRTVRAGIDPKLWRAGLLPNDGAGLPAD